MWVERKLEGDRMARMKLDAGAVERRQALAQGGQARGLDRDRRCGPASPSSATSRRSRRWRRGVSRCGFGPWETVLGPVLRLRHLRQRRLHARAGVQVHVPLCALPERDVRQGHADHHLRRRARRAARLALAARPTRKALGLGDCVDCGLCVQVCPTGIDIRKGLQYECIGCAACIDVCDEVMDKMGYPRGLIRYDTQNGLAQHLTRAPAPARASSARACWSTPRSWC